MLNDTIPKYQKIVPKNPEQTENKLKIVFLGTPEFSLPTLKKLTNSRFRPDAVFCAPDKPTSRRQILTPPPIKILARQYAIKIYQPTDKKELTEQIAALKPDLIITAAYGLILPTAVLATPKFGCLNIHPSLLPRYRGPSPIQIAILNGDKTTGVAILQMNEKIDAGPIIAQRELLIDNQNITAPELSKLLAESGADLLLKILPNWLTGKIKSIKQNDILAVNTKIIKKEDGRIGWQKSASEIQRQIRAFLPWPGSFTDWPTDNGRRQTIKILSADTTEKNYCPQTGKIVLTNAGEIAIQTGQGALIVKKLQMAGKKSTDAQEFLRGHKNFIGAILN